MKNVILIPAYMPNKELIKTVDSLVAHNLQIVVINDGSGDAYKSIFEAIKDKATIVHLPNNSGKGAALKHGMVYIMENCPGCENIITADADGQHRTKDILRVITELEMGAEFILTFRKFSKDMPFRSKFGNALSRYVYTILNGHYLPDNQSGLRGFKKEHLSWLIQVGGNKYDYEMNMLYYADKQGITITTIPIEAVYIDNNSSSHFNPVKDTIRIYSRLFYSARVTFSTVFVVQPLIILMSVLFEYNYLQISIPLIGASATAVNIILNRFVVFRNLHYRDYARVVMATIIRYLSYTVFCFLAKVYAPAIPLWVAFDICALLLVPLEYIFYKYTYLSKYKDINKV